MAIPDINIVTAARGQRYKNSAKKNVIGIQHFGYKKRKKKEKKSFNQEADN